MAHPIHPSFRRSFVALLLFLLASFAAAAIGNIATSATVRDWYPTLAKPSWTPPAWLFGPVWTFLYLCIGVAGFLAWRKTGLAGAPRTMALYTMQLVLNAAWSWIFFGFRQPGWAFAEIVLLLLAIAATTAGLWRISIPAGVLFVPYLLWVSFATTLHFAIWRLN